MEDPIALPPFSFDEELSEDDNFLTWATVLARMSFSKKGHMGAIIVKPPEKEDPTYSIRRQCPVYVNTKTKNGNRFVNRLAENAKGRVLIHGNNTPLLYNDSPKQVPEIHAEALCISRSAREGIKLQGSTIYVTFPPCHECFRLIGAAGIKRCVFRKSISSPSGDAALVAARVLGIELCGMGDFKWEDILEAEDPPLNDSDQAEEEDDPNLDEDGHLTAEASRRLNDEIVASFVTGKFRSSARRSEAIANHEASLKKPRVIAPSRSPTQEELEKHRAIVKQRELASELRAKEAWERMGETTQVTRTRVKEWWERWNEKYKREAKALKLTLGQTGAGARKKSGNNQEGKSNSEDETDSNQGGQARVSDQTTEGNLEESMEMQEEEARNASTSRGQSERATTFNELGQRPSSGKRSPSPLERSDAKEARKDA